MVEEMQRTSVQSQLDAMAVQFETATEADERIEAAFMQLTATVRFYLSLYLLFT